MIQIPNYTVKKVIGRGGMALVYLAVQDMLNREVALKVLLPDMTKDDNLRKSFLNEGKIVASLDHPNIVSIFDIGVADDSIFYMTMEYISGGTLKEKLLTDRFSYKETLKILEEIAEGLFYAHDKGYIHRDIKPGNILFRDDGSAVLTDFGIAKLQDTSGDLTRLGLTAGTAQYMSPEQAKSSNLDSRSDIYSLGLVFFEILTGEKAFEFETHFQAIQQHTMAAPPKLPKEYAFLQKVINKVLAKKPKDRYQSALEFFQAVRNADHSSLISSTSTGNTIHTDETIIHGIKPPLINHLKRKPYLLLSLLTGLILFGGIIFSITKYSNKTIEPNKPPKVVSTNLVQKPAVKPDAQTPQEKGKIQVLTSNTKSNSSDCKRGKVFINGIQVGKPCKNEKADKPTLSKKPTVKPDAQTPQEKDKIQVLTSNTKSDSSDCKRGKVFINGIQVGKPCKNEKADEPILSKKSQSKNRFSEGCKNLSSLVKEELTVESFENDFLGTPISEYGDIKDCAQKDLYHQLKIYKKAFQKSDYETADKFIYPPVSKGRSLQNLSKILKLPYFPDDNVIKHTQVIEIPIKKYSKGIYARTLYNIEMSMDFATSQEELQDEIKNGYLKGTQQEWSEYLKEARGAFNIRFKKDTLEANFFTKGQNIAIYEINKGWSIMGYDSKTFKIIKGDLPNEVTKYLSRFN